jgi:hypothetical protein
MEVVRGFLLPKRGDKDQPLYAKRIKEEEAEVLLDKYKELIEYIIKIFIKMRNNKKIINIKDFNEFLNYYVLKLKSLLYLDPIPNIIPSPLIPEYYVEMISENKKIDLCTYEGIKEYARHFGDPIEGKLKEYSEIFKENEKYHKILFELLDFPADTRTAANTSSLIIHMLTVSGIASAIAKEEGLSEKDILIVRLISLFHDVGKFKIREWYRHPENSAIFLRKVLENYVEEEAEKILEEACELLSREKELEFKEKILQIFKRADRIASGIDRLKSYLVKYIEVNPEAQKKFQQYIRAYGKTSIEEVYDEWKFWESLKDKDKEDLTADFCKKIKNLVAQLKSEDRPLDVKLYLARIDLRSIQSFIKSTELRIINAGSRIVDVITYFGIPLKLIELSLPPECILYFGGGNVTLIIPEKMKDDILKSKFGDVIETVIRVAPLYGDFIKTNEELEMNLAMRKIQHQTSKKVEMNIFKLCESCGSRPAEIREGEKSLCSSCKNKYDIGSYIHFMPRTYLYLYYEKKLELEEVSRKLGQILKDAPVYISGVETNKVGEAVDEYPDLAMIRFDGNIVGSFMASCVSITDAHERSIRIDWSVKKAVHEFFEIVKNVGKEEDYLRLILGIMYLGGDDGALIMPSGYAIPFALYLSNEFYLNSGCQLTLSLAIISAKPKHPLIPLYESCGELLDEIVKSKCRDLAYKASSEMVEKASNEFRGAIGFYTTDGGFILKENIEGIFKDLDRERVSYQYVRPYVISEVKTENYLTIYSLLKPILDQLNVQYRNMKELVENLLSKLMKENERKNTIESIKELKRIALDAMQINVYGDRSIEIKLIYDYKEGRKDSQYKKLIENLFIISKQKDSKNLYLCVHDLITAIKILGGGEI